MEEIMRISQKIMPVLFVLLLGLCCVLGVSAFPGFHDVTHESCLGDDDPFCAPGGGGSGAPCRWCEIVTNENGDPISASCYTGSQGTKTECTATLDADGASCSLSGDNC